MYSAQFFAQHKNIREKSPGGRLPAIPEKSASANRGPFVWPMPSFSPGLYVLCRPVVGSHTNPIYAREQCCIFLRFVHWRAHSNFSEGSRLRTRATGIAPEPAGTTRMTAGMRGRRPAASATTARPWSRTRVTSLANASEASHKLARPSFVRVGINSSLLRRGHAQRPERVRSLRLHVWHGRALRLGKGDL